MLILADLGYDPKHWPLEAATAADRSDDRGALFGGRDSGGPIRPPRKAFLVSRHQSLGTTIVFVSFNNRMRPLVPKVY